MIGDRVRWMHEDRVRTGNVLTVLWGDGDRFTAVVEADDGVQWVMSVDSIEKILQEG